jgi:RNA polymerase sigma-32 factor
MTSTLDSSLSHYISSVNRFPKLSREEESELWRKWQSESDRSAKEALIRANMRHSVSLAFKYRSYGIPLAELISEGNFGLVHALSKFEPQRGNRFLTYAVYWIRAYVLDHIIRSWSLVGIGSGALRSKLFFKLRRERVRIHNLVGEGEQANGLLATLFGVSPEKMTAYMQQLETRDLSLDIKVSEDSLVSLVDTLQSPGLSQELVCMNAQSAARQRDIVRIALSALDNRERYIIESRLMCDQEDGLSLAHVGRTFGVTRERARQIEVRAKRKLKDRILELTGQNVALRTNVNSAA